MLKRDLRDSRPLTDATDSGSAKPEPGSLKEAKPGAKGKAEKGAGRMPWHQEPKKDVTSCEKPWGGAHIPGSTDV